MCRHVRRLQVVAQVATNRAWWRSAPTDAFEGVFGDPPAAFRARVLMPVDPCPSAGAGFGDLDRGQAVVRRDVLC
jgi:hypothetical protein